jgi:hypothetical protein
VISDKGITPDPKKTDAIRNYPRPITISQLKSFLGLAGYYRKFIKNFAEKAHALTMLKK